MKNNQIHSFNIRQNMQNNRFEIFHYRDLAMRNVSLHHHDFYEVYFLISGEVTYLIEGKQYDLEAGDVVLINTKELHQAVIHEGNASYERIVLWINKAYLESFSTTESHLTQCFEAATRENVIHTDFDSRRVISELLNKILAMESFTGVCGDLLSEAYFVEVLVKLNNMTHSKPQIAAQETAKNRLINDMIDYIEEHLTEKITVDQLSEQFYLSKYHLLREFKKYVGVNIHKYIVLKRLIRAKALILENRPITEVAELAGFGDYTHFFRAFKSAYDLTPKQFYEMMKEDN